ncbi:hypothetical protein, partial [Paramuribaculum intestinale]|uniref:hypothetical protein n=1 Tax=Paramuribaculum intestinale TaxID=2094151 RepID=UPI0025B732C3
MMSLNRIHIPVVSDSRGSLAFIEQGGAVPFVPSSVWLASVPSRFDGCGAVVALRGSVTVGGSLTIGAVFAFVSYSWYVTGPVSALLNLKMYFARI